MGTKITKQKSANCPHISWDQYGVIKWKYFLSYWPFVRGIHSSPVDSPHKGQWRRVLMFSLMPAWTNSYANNRDAGDLRYHHAHYDVTVMWTVSSVTLQSWPSVQQGKSEGFDSCDRPSNLKLDSNRQFFRLCDREIWWMTLQKYRTPLLCNFKLCASFRSHWWIQTWVTVRKRPIWVKLDDF